MSANEKKCILIVDDEADLRNLLNSVLSGAGYDTAEAADGKEAIAIVQKRVLDLALLDIRMPKMDGIEVLTFLHKNSPSTKAIMLTGYADLKYAMEAKEYGAKDFISKPYKTDDVLSTVRRILGE